MKKLIAFILSASFILCLYGCNNNINDEDNAQGSSVTMDVPSREEGDFILYGNAEQNILVYNAMDPGSFQQPHRIGDSVRLRHSDINIGQTDPDNVDIYDYNLTFAQMLTGKEAEQKLKESCNNFDEEKYLLEENDLYLIQVNVKYNAESAIKDRLPVDIYVAAVNSQGNFVNAEHRFDDSSYNSNTENGEVSNWYPVLTPKGEEMKPVFVIGSPMEYPGPVVTVYYDGSMN